MAWSKEKQGFYCDRCGASIWMGNRQQRFIEQDRVKSTKRHLSGDPHITIDRFAFFDEKESTTANRLMFCFDCEPIVMAVLEALKQGPNQMTDFALCRNFVCPLKDNCKRAQQSTAEKQTFGSFGPDIEGKCVNQMPIKEPT